MKKILAWVASLFSLYMLMWWFLQIILEESLSKIINDLRPAIVLEYETLHLDFFLRFLEITGVQMIPQKQELGVFFVSSLKLGNWGKKQNYWTAQLYFQNIHVASAGAFKKILENLKYSDDALDTEAEISFAYEPTSQTLMVDFLQDTPQLGHLKGTTTLNLKTNTLTALEIQYKEKTFLKQLIQWNPEAKTWIPEKCFMHSHTMQIRLKPQLGYSVSLPEILSSDYAQLLSKLEVTF